MKAIILAAEGVSLSKTRALPTCLQPIVGGSNMLDQQIRLLNIYGIPSKEIFVVVGETGNWALVEAKEELQRYPEIEIITNSSNSLTTSEYSFYAAIDRVGYEQDILVINADSIFDIRQLESLCKCRESSSVLTKKPTSINERGIKLRLSQANRLSVCTDNANNAFPWILYAGVTYISSSDLKTVCERPPALGTDGFLYSLDATLGIEFVRNVDYNSLEISSCEESDSLDLRGGSFASLERKHLVRKEARGKGFNKLTDEIDWLQELPKHLKQFFPSVISSGRSEDWAWFEMPWYDAPSLRKNIMTGIYSPEKAWMTLRGVLDFMFRDIYSNVHGKNNDGIDWVASKHIIRVRDRVTEVHDSNSVMRGIVRAPYLIINGKRYRNIPECLLMIAQRTSLLKQLSPKVLRMIHGDFHFQNILVEFSGNEKGFILADPRGELEGSDLYYDMGKLWHSFNGMYDLIHTDLCKATKTSSRNGVTSYELTYSNKQMVRTYSQIKGLSTTVLEEYNEVRDDPDWLVKTLFSEAMHFCSVSAFHLKNDEDENRASSLYLRGVQLINEFVGVSELLSYEVDSSLVKMCLLDEWHERISDQCVNNLQNSG